MNILKSIIGRSKKYKYHIAWMFPAVIILLAFLTGNMPTEQLAFANGINTSTNEMAETVSFLNSLLKVIYIVLRPLLVVAGMALDNSLVLGEVFHLDAALRKFWTIMTTFANFALGFVVLFHIVKYVLGFNDDTKPVFDIIKKALLAGVGIQVSRFVILALLDLSSIAIYSVGAMPLQVLENTQLDDKVIMTMHSKIDFDKMNDSNNDSNDSAYSVYYSCGANYYGPCLVQSGYVIGPQSDFDDVTVDNSYCVMGGMYANQNLIKIPGSDNSCVSLRGDGTSGAPETCQSFKEMHEVTVSPNEAEALGCEGMSTLLGQSKGFVKVLVTIYASLLDFANINLTDEQLTTGGALVVFLLKLLVALALIVPLLALAVVLLVRVAYLWLIIAFAPLLVIKNVFFKDMQLLGNIKIAGAEMGDRFQDIIAAIFMPVIVVFALSLGIIFLKITIDAMNPADVGRSRLVQQEFGFERIENNDGLLIYGVGPVQVGYQRPTESYALSMFLDFFAYMVVNLFAIGLLRVLFFAAMKSSKFLGEVGGKIDKTGRQVMGSLPVIPIPGGGKAGISTVFNTDYDSLLGRGTSKILERNRRLNEEAVQGLFGEDQAKSLEQGETQNIAKRVLANGSTILEATDKELGKRYDETYAANYVNAVTPELISMANASTNADQKANALASMTNQAKTAQNQQQLANIFGRRRGLSLAGATGASAWAQFAGGVDDQKEFVLANGEKYFFSRKDDGSIELLDKDGKPVQAQEATENTSQKQNLSDAGKVDVLFSSMQSSNGQENLDQLAAKANGDQQGDYHTDELRGLLATRAQSIQSDDSNMKQLGATILRDINDASDKSKMLERWSADATLKEAIAKSLADKDQQQYSLGGAQVLKLENYSGNESDSSKRTISTSRKDWYQENMTNPQSGMTWQTWTQQTGIEDINKAIQGKVGDWAGFFAQETITKNNETYKRNTSNQAFEKEQTK